MKRFLIPIWIFSLILIQKSFSQSNFSIHTGTAVPVFDFASSGYENNKAGQAAPGFNIGFEYRSPVSKSGISAFFSIDLNHNALQKDVRDETEKYFKEQFEIIGIENGPVSHYKYLNIPVCGGFQYTYKLDSNFSVFANGGFAFNFLEITNFEIDLGNDDLIVDFYATNKLGYKLGIGGSWKDKILLSVNYFSIGEIGVEGTMRYGKYREDVGDYKINIYYLTLTLGYRF